MLLANASPNATDTRTQQVDANGNPVPVSEPRSGGSGSYTSGPVNYTPTNYQPQYTPTGYNKPATAPATTASTDQYQQRINQQLDALARPVDANSAVVRAQTDAYDMTADRGLAANRAALAQAAYASGNLGSGSYDMAQARAREAAALGKAQNTGNVIATAEGQRQAQLGNFMNLGQQGSLSQQQITNQANQFADTLGLNQAQLRAQEAQFGAGLGLSAAQLRAMENQFGANFLNGQYQFGVNTDLQRQALNNALDIARMNNATQRYGIDTNYNLGEDTLTNNGLNGLDA